MRQPNIHTVSAAARWPVRALHEANMTVAQMIGAAGVIVGYEAKVEASATTPAMLGDEPVDAVVEYVATVVVHHLPEEPS